MSCAWFPLAFVRPRDLHPSRSPMKMLERLSRRLGCALFSPALDAVFDWGNSVPSGEALAANPKLSKSGQPPCADVAKMGPDRRQIETGK